MTLDIKRLRELLAAVPCAQEWDKGLNSHCIETTQRASDGDIYGRTLFTPDERDEYTLAEAQLAVEAVNALPQLLAIAEAAIAIRDSGVVVSGGECDRVACSAGLVAALLAAVDAARKAGT